MSAAPKLEEAAPAPVEASEASVPPPTTSRYRFASVRQTIESRRPPASHPPGGQYSWEPQPTTPGSLLARAARLAGRPHEEFEIPAVGRIADVEQLLSASAHAPQVKPDRFVVQKRLRLHLKEDEAEAAPRDAPHQMDPTLFTPTHPKALECMRRLYKQVVEEALGFNMYRKIALEALEEFDVASVWPGYAGFDEFKPKYGSPRILCMARVPAIDSFVMFEKWINEDQKRRFKETGSFCCEVNRTTSYQALFNRALSTGDGSKILHGNKYVLHVREDHTLTVIAMLSRKAPRPAEQSASATEEQEQQQEQQQQEQQQEQQEPNPDEEEQPSQVTSVN